MKYSAGLKLSVRSTLAAVFAGCLYLPYQIFGVLPLFSFSNKFAEREDARLLNAPSEKSSAPAGREEDLIGPDRIFANLDELNQAKKDWVWCGFCHYTAANAPHRIGPNLNAILGRRVGSKAKYYYTKSLRDAAEVGQIWTEELLDEFLADPQGVFPGNRMRYAPVAEPERRQRIIKYIRAFSG